MIPDIEIFMHDIVVHVVQGDISLRDVPKEWKSGAVPLLKSWRRNLTIRVHAGYM